MQTRESPKNLAELSLLPFFYWYYDTQVDRVLRPEGCVVIVMKSFNPSIIEHPKQEELTSLLHKVHGRPWSPFLCLVEV